MCQERGAPIDSSAGQIPSLRLGMIRFSSLSARAVGLDKYATKFHRSTKI